LDRCAVKVGWRILRQAGPADAVSHGWWEAIGPAIRRIRSGARPEFS
jgi:hypothetical protein